MHRVGDVLDGVTQVRVASTVGARLGRAFELRILMVRIEVIHRVRSAMNHHVVRVLMAALAERIVVHDRRHSGALAVVVDQCEHLRLGGASCRRRTWIAERRAHDLHHRR